MEKRNNLQLLLLFLNSWKCYKHETSQKFGTSLKHVRFVVTFSRRLSFWWHNWNDDNLWTWIKLYVVKLTLFRIGIFGAAHRWGAKRPPLPKIWHTYPTMMNLGTVIPYLKKNQKIYQSRDTHPEFCWHKHFFSGNQHILLYQEIQV